MRNIRIVIEYDGSNYHGFQDQARDDRPTIQAILNRAISETTGESVRIVGAGRTDAGVHALGQVANFSTASRIPIERIPVAINSRLPEDIAVRTADVVPPHFHSLACARRKLYRYTWFVRSSPSPFWRRYAHFVPRTLDIAAMEQAVAYFVGEHDFAAFRSAHSSARTTVRRIYRAQLIREDPVLHFEVEGNGFLYNMVRIMAGTLHAVGLGRRSPDCVTEALRVGERELAGPTAPAHGLTLVAVEYDEPIEGNLG